MNELPHLTRRQREIYQYLLTHLHEYPHPPSLDQICKALGLRSRGSLHKQIQALIDAGLVEPMNNLRRGIRLTDSPSSSRQDELPLFGYIAAGQPIAAITSPEFIPVPPLLRSDKPCYVLRVRGDSMIEEGILDGDWVIIEHADQACDGEIVVALVDGEDATLKRIERKSGKVILHPANSAMEPLTYAPEQVRIQGILKGQMRRYH